MSRSPPVLSISLFESCNSSREEQRLMKLQMVLQPVEVMLLFESERCFRFYSLRGDFKLDFGIDGV